MTTKKQIWGVCVPRWKLLMTAKGHNSAMEAMEQYAKEIAIGFAGWLNNTIIGETTSDKGEMLYFMANDTDNG